MLISRSRGTYLIAILSQVSKPKATVAEKQRESENLSGMFFQRSKKSTPKRVKQASQEAKQQQQQQEKGEEEGEGDTAPSTPHTRTAGMAFYSLKAHNVNK